MRLQLGVDTRKKGISTFIAVLLLMVLVVAAGLVIYAYTMGYLGGIAVKPANSALQVDMVGEQGSEVQIWLRNIGQDDVNIEGSTGTIRVYINGVYQENLGTDLSDKDILKEGETCQVSIPMKNFDVGTTNNVKIMTSSGAFVYTLYKVTGTVTATNQVPIMGSIGAKTLDEMTLLTFTATATDPDLPLQTLTFSVDAGAPSGASINPSSGVFTWTPSEAQGPGDYSITVRVTDNGSPAFNDYETISVHVNEVASANQAPVLGAIGNKNIDEQATLVFTASATDLDVPPQTLTYSIDPGYPTGANINPSTGAFTWTPTEAQGPGSYPITVRVTDDGSPNINDYETITVTVNEVNQAPVLGPIGNKIGDELTQLTFTAAAADADVPADTLVFSLDSGAPSGASINAVTGVFTWTPTEANGPGDYTVTVRVTDNSSPALSDFETISVHVNEVASANQAPVLSPIGNKSGDELTKITFDADATDLDAGDTLVFSLDAGAPSGASINPSSGVFTWTPTEAQGSGDYSVTVRVTDNGSPMLNDFETISIHVNEVNVAPILTSIGNKNGNELTAISFTATATDSDLPPQTLAFSLQGTPPTGASITSGGIFTWTPTEAQGPGSYPLTVRVTDNGSPTQYNEEVLTVTVNEVNVSPTLAAVPDKTLDELTQLTFTAVGSDTDLPANTLTYILTGSPTGANIVSSSGVFTWTPTEAQGPGDYTFTIRVTDSGSLYAEKSVKVHVNEVADPSVLDHFDFDTITGPKTAGTAFDITIRAKDQYNQPFTTYTGTNTLTVSSGTIAPINSGAFSAGVRTVSVTLYTTGSGITIGTTGSTKIGSSNTFTVNAGSGEFGYHTQGSNDEDIENYITGGQFICSQSGTAQSISAFIGSVSGSTHNIKGALYSTTGTLLGYTEEKPVTTSGDNQWITFNFQVGHTPSLTAGTSYVIVIWANNPSGSSSATLAYSSSGGTGRYYSSSYNSNWPTPITFSSDGSRNYSVYCTYSIP